MTTKETADALGVSESTIQRHHRHRRGREGSHWNKIKESK